MDILLNTINETIIFYKLTENQFKIAIKSLHSDNAAEFKSNSRQNFVMKMTILLLFQNPRV